MRNVLKSSLVAATLIATPFAQADFLDNLSVNIGVIHANPNSDTSKIKFSADGTDTPYGLSVGSDTQLGITLDYALNDNWVVELIAATPFSHDISGEEGLEGADLGSVKHLPPTLLAQYHFSDASSAFRPFVGAGLNYTMFFDEQASSTLTDFVNDNIGAGNVDLKLDDSFGLAAQVGFNYMLDQQFGIHAVATYMDIDSDADVLLNNKAILTSSVAIDPMVFMLGMKYKF